MKQESIHCSLSPTVGVMLVAAFSFCHLEFPTMMDCEPSLVQRIVPQQPEKNRVTQRGTHLESKALAKGSSVHLKALIMSN